MLRLALALLVLGSAGTAEAQALKTGDCIALQVQQADGTTSVQVLKIRGEGKGGYYLRSWVDHMWQESWLSIDMNLSKAQLERLERVTCPR